MLVLSSEKAKQMFKRFNLTPAEYLRPFGHYVNKQVKIKSINKDKVIEDLKFDFIDLEEYRLPSY